MTKEFKKGRSMAELANSLAKSYGPNAAVFGGLQKQLKSIPTGSLALDYELGTGGWKIGGTHTIYGPPDIGKSSMIGLSAIRNAQAMGLNCVYIPVEPVGDVQWRRWITANGVNVDDLLVLYPGMDSPGEDAMAMLIECTKTPDVGVIVFDSIGSLLSESEVAEDGKPKVGGQAGLITWAMKQAAPNAWHNDICLILLNQVRQDMNPRSYGGYKMPGGEALKHESMTIVQLRPGKERYMVKRDGTDIMAGRQIVAQIHRNKGCEGSGHKAVFDYFFMETKESDAVGFHPLGIDAFTDTINTAKRTGVIKQSGAYYELPNGHKVQGMAKVQEYLDQQPDVLTIVREGVLESMLQRNEKIEEEDGQEGDE